MRRAGFRRRDEPRSSSQNDSPERNFFRRDNALWCSKNNGDPCSPLSVERLPEGAKKTISKVVRMKKKENSNRGKGKRPDLGSDTPFYIDKTPTSVEDHEFRKRKCENFNDSVILLDSPKPVQNSVPQSKRLESVDVVDLCSDSDEEEKKPKQQRRAKITKVEKISKIAEQPKNDSLDVILLDDDEKSVNPTDSTSSKSTSTTHLTSKESSSSNSNKIDPVKVNLTSSSVDKRFDPISINHTNSLPTNDYSIPTSTSLTTYSQSKSVTTTNLTLPPYLRKLNDISSSSSNMVFPMDSSSIMGSNMFNPNEFTEQRGLRPIVIDGCNVAIGHGGDRTFSVRGLCICVEYFLRRGHTQVCALVPLHLRAKLSPGDRFILDSLQDDKHLVFTPSRYIKRTLYASYDDRFIVQYAATVGGVIVSRDNYRDLLDENDAWKDTILNRLLMPTWVGDVLMFPVDPMGKHGPTLDEFLRFPES